MFNKVILFVIYTNLEVIHPSVQAFWVVKRQLPSKPVNRFDFWH